MFGSRAWETEKLAELEQSSEVVATARGPIEVRREGTENFILYVHGTPGGHDQGCALHAAYAAQGYGMLSLSRPGYLRTPLATGPDAASSADAYAALLDALDIDSVFVHGVSGGGPSSIEFAARHPDRVRRLVLSCSVSQPLPAGIAGKILVGVLASSTLGRLQLWMLRKYPRSYVASILGQEGDYTKEERARITEEICDDADRMAFIAALTDSALPGRARMDGLKADLGHFGTLALPCAEIRCPTLVVHGRRDADVPFAHAEHSLATIPDARLHEVPDASHLLWVSPHAQAMTQAIVEFLGNHSPASQA